MIKNDKDEDEDEDEVLDRILEECMTSMDKSSDNFRRWYCDNKELMAIKTDPNEVAAEFRHDSHDSRTASYPQFRRNIESAFQVLGFDFGKPELSENQLLLSGIGYLGHLKEHGIMNFQVARSPFDMRKEVSSQLRCGATMRGIEFPHCASDRGVSKDLTDRLVGHDKTITNVGVLFDNATSVEYSTGSQFFPTDQLEYRNTGFAIGIKTKNRSSCFAVLGDTYTQNGKSYRTYRGKIIEKQKQKQKPPLYFNGIKGGGKYLEPTIEKLAADTAYNGGATDLDELSLMSLKYGGDASQRIMAAGAMKAGVPSTVTTGDGNMFKFSLDGITFEGSKDPIRFPVVYGKMRTLQDPEQTVIVNNGAKSLIISAWPDQGSFTDEQITINKEINAKKRILEDTASNDRDVLEFIHQLDMLASQFSNISENIVNRTRIRRDTAP